MQSDFMQTNKARLLPLAQALLPELIALSDALYERPELGYEEFFACEQHTALLERARLHRGAQLLRPAHCLRRRLRLGQAGAACGLSGGI